MTAGTRAGSGIRLTGAELAADIRARVAASAAALTAAGRVPRLAVVVATTDESTAWYVRSIARAASKVGIACDIVNLADTADGGEIQATLRGLSDDPSVHGIILQTPLPTGVSFAGAASAIDPAKDVDGANPASLGRLAAFPPATAQAVVALLEHCDVPLAGREVAVVGRSTVVGKPLAQLLLDRDATVTVCHSRTANLAAVTRRAEILIAAVGRAGLIGIEHVRPDAMVIDVGTNATDDGGLVGDVDPAVEAHAAGLTAVPGGVGPVTTARLLEHTVRAAEKGKRSAMTRYVYDFSEGDKDQKDLLGGKGANLAEMVKLGLPVPPGFTISTEACRAYLSAGATPDGLDAEIADHLAALEAARGKKLGDPDDPLLVSVRSGAKFSMPGMMETVLNIGLNDDSVHGLAVQADSARFAWDSYRRLIQMFGKTVQHIEGERFEHALDELKRSKGVTADLDLNADDMQQLVAAFKRIVAEETGTEFPQDPREQLTAAINAVFSSWNSDRAVLYRRQERIPNDLGTAVNVVAMVFGNTGPDSGTGVCFTRDPATGAPGIYGDYLQNAQGEDVVAGIRNTVPLAHLEGIDKASYDQLLEIMALLEGHYRDLCDIEFTIERGTLWMLQTRVGKRTAGAAFRIAGQLVDEDVIDADEAVRRVSGVQLVQLMFPQFDTAVSKTVLSRGIPASPGAAVGKAVFDSYTAVKWSRSGEKVVLVRRETNPDDLNGMIAAEGILTSRGGKTSHAAVVARGMGKTCVCGAEELDVDTKRRRLTAPDGTVVHEGDVISVDGSTGQVFAGEVAVVPSPVVEYFEGTLDPNAPEADDLVRAVHRIMSRADGVRRLRVRANADTVADAERARRFGGEGVGLCRTEHMFLGERRQHVERLILAEDDKARDAALEALLPLQRWDFLQLLSAMDGLPTTIRLLDPPLHEFLPNITELSVRVALAEARGEANENDLRLMQAVHSLHEQNPMLGLRGVRLGLVVPGLFDLQVRAIAEATAQLVKLGKDPRPEIMIPLVGSVQELEIIEADAKKVLAGVVKETGVNLAPPLGTMIELPRAALTAGQIAESADFFSFGTNDLTQTTWGFSRDDVEAAFFSTYLEMGIFGVSPFETIDIDGVGELVEIGVERGRATRPDLKVGVCGEHGGDPDSVHFFHRAGLDYVSCSPFRIPVARLEAARVVLSGTGASAER